ncbi:MAG: HAMP domain-containing sensor histidine kinase [Candidatus Nitrosopolaris sp.]
MYQSDVINGISDIFYNSEHRVAICGNSRFPSLIFSFESIRKAIVDAKNRGIRQRYIFEITKENINYCKELMRMVDDLQVRHSDQIEANFALNETEYLSSITMKERHQAIYSNVREIVEQEGSIFETVWNTSLPAKYRIREIQEGTESDFLEVIYDAQKARDIYIDLARSVDNEALLLFANSKAMVRAERLGVVDYLVRASKKGASIKIICPITEENSEIITQISEKAPGIRILNGGDSHSGLFIVNNAKFIRFEIKELQAEDFTDAVGFIVYSNTKVSVYSSRSFFELLWKERVQYEKLKEADEMKSEFINVAAHELRTPIQPILTLTEVLRSKIKDTEQLAMLDAAIRNAKRLRRLTEDILDITKIEGKSLQLEKEQFNLYEVILNVVQDYRSQQIENRTIDIQVLSDEPNKDIVVNADKSRIAQVISNLLSNAIKFTKLGAVLITIEKKKDNKEVIVSMKDTGSGLDPEILPRLFSKFASKSFKGTGLGLFISKSIVEAHGGKIWAENNVNGKGAKFSFSLPTKE